MTQLNGAHATNGREWRQLREQLKEEGVLYQLPSSMNWIRLRLVSIDALMLAGRIPDFLTPLAASVLWQPKWITQDEAQKILEDAKSAREYIELINIIVPAAMMEPRIVDNPQADDEISLDDLDIHDRFHIFNLAKQPQGWLHRFRHEQAANVEPVHDSEAEQPATEPASTDSGPVDGSTV
jgi:hypothetical protein